VTGLQHENSLDTVETNDAWWKDVSWSDAVCVWLVEDAARTEERPAEPCVTVPPAMAAAAGPAAVKASDTGMAGMSVPRADRVEPITGIRKAMVKAMTRAQLVPHFGYDDEVRGDVIFCDTRHQFVCVMFHIHWTDI